MTNNEADDEQRSCYRCGDPATLAAAGTDNVFQPMCRECFERCHEDSNDTLWLLLAAVTVAAGGAALGEAFSAILLLSVVYLVGALAGWWTFLGASVSMRP